MSKLPSGLTNYSIESKWIIIWSTLRLSHCLSRGLTKFKIKVTNRLSSHLIYLSRGQLPLQQIWIFAGRKYAICTAYCILHNCKLLKIIKGQQCAMYSAVKSIYNACEHCDYKHSSCVPHTTVNSNQHHLWRAARYS